MFPAQCSELPNDNPRLHDGAIFRIEALGGVATAEPVPENVAADAIAVVAVEPEIVEKLQEIVTASESEPVIDIDEKLDTAKMISRPSGIYLSSDDEDDEIVIAPIDPLEDPEVFAAPRDTVSDELAPIADHLEIPPPPLVAKFDDVDREAAEKEVPTRELRDPFSELVAIMESIVARTSPENATALAALVLHGEARAFTEPAHAALVQHRILRDANGVEESFDSVRLAWRALLNGESEEFPGSLPLDEWTADLVARALGAPSRAPEIRRDLRSRGVAAFGLVDVAA